MNLKQLLTILLFTGLLFGQEQSIPGWGFYGGMGMNNLNSTLKCNSKTGCRKSGAAVGFALFSQSNKRCTNETLQPAHAGKKIRNIFVA